MKILWYSSRLTLITIKRGGKPIIIGGQFVVMRVGVHQLSDITATGHCEYWITTIDLMEYQEKSTLSSPDDTMLLEVYTDTVACIYNVDGKC
jgi:hypothetical protein